MLQLLQRFTSPPVQTLTTLQPTPSTVRFTVSTRPVPRTVFALLGYYVSILFRVVFGALALFTLLVKWELRSGRQRVLHIILGTGGEAWITQWLQDLRWRYLIPVVSVILYLVLRRGYTEESLLALQSLGLQTSTTSSTYLRTPTTRFIPATAIQDIFIHEAFIGFEVRFYLAIVVKGEEDVVVVFPRLLPRRDVLEKVWRGARACLYDVGLRKVNSKQKDSVKGGDDLLKDAENQRVER